MDLEQLHMQTVELLGQACANWGLPKEVPIDEKPEQIPSASTLAGNLEAALRLAHSSELQLLEKGQSAQVTAMRANMRRVRELSERIEACQENLVELRGSYSSVTSRTSALHDACDRSMAHQTSLAAGSEQIRANLHYFKQADIIMKKLSDRGRVAVTAPSFSSLLSSIDDGLSFLRAHPEYKESALYIQKYEQCLSRAMTWIRVKVLADLESSVETVKKKQAELSIDWARVDHADEDTRALLYGIFASNAASVKCALGVAEQRFAQVPEFEEMVSECYTSYFQLRQQLLAPIIESTLNKLTGQYINSCCTLARTGCLFLIGVCGDEFRLFRQFFALESSGKSNGSTGRASPTPSIMSMNTTRTGYQRRKRTAFDAFSESITRLLYDVLRPIIVHNPHLETLAELCSIIKLEMVEERCMAQQTESALGDPYTGFVIVAGDLIGDVQERIVYRASQYGQNDIINYTPVSGDLAYPERLEMMRKIEDEQRAKREGENGEADAGSEASFAVDLHCLWYPTVRRTVVCLAKLFKCLELSVFESLARELLVACCESLDAAALFITNGVDGRKGRPLDAHLFVVKHLLILREQTAPYRSAATRSGQSTIHSRDFSLSLTKVRDSASNFIYNMSTDAFLELLFSVSAPVQVCEVVGDSRRVVDNSLRTRCNQLIDCCAGLLARDFEKLVADFEQEAKKEGFAIARFPQFSSEKIRDCAAETQRRLGKEWPVIRASFSLYIGVAETEAILLQPVKKRIVDLFGRAAALTARWLGEEGVSITAIPSPQHIHLLLNKA